MISRKIHYFLTLAECLSFTQTAAKYEVTQTAVSQYIAALEERVGLRLFDRNRHSVALTEGGQYYYNHVKGMISEYDRIVDQARVLAAGFHGSLKVGVGMYEYRSTETLFSAFLTGHPEIRVDIMQYPYSELIEKLRSGDLDIIIADSFCESSFAKNELKVRHLFESPIELVAEESVARRNDMDISGMLKNECLVTNCESDGPNSMQMLDILLREAVGFVPENIAQTNTINAQLMLVRAGHGVAIVPEFIADRQCADLVRIPMPSDRIVRVELMMLANGGNKAADLLFEFEG